MFVLWSIQAYDGVKADVFAVGCMAFMMFTLTQPFTINSLSDRQFKKVVYRGKMQEFLLAEGLPLLPPKVR